MTFYPQRPDEVVLLFLTFVQQSQSLCHRTFRAAQAKYKSTCRHANHDFKRLEVVRAFSVLVLLPRKHLLRHDVCSRSDQQGLAEAADSELTALSLLPLYGQLQLLVQPPKPLVEVLPGITSNSSRPVKGIDEYKRNWSGVAQSLVAFTSTQLICALMI
eukprot:759928-Hanusia_phi.AAC.3